MASREELVFKIKLGEQAERFEDMVNFSNELIKQNPELNNDERNLISVAYKNSIGTRRTSWRALAAIEAKDEEKGGKHKEVIANYKKIVISELEKISNEVVKMIDTYLLPKSTPGDTKIFYLKMKGDYYRYYAEALSGEKQQQVGKLAAEAYEAATKDAESALAKTNPIRLGLALNYSVFYYEIMNNPDKAITIAKTAFDGGIADLDNLEDEVYKVSDSIMQLLRDNLTLWQSEKDEKGGDAKEEK